MKKLLSAWLLGLIVVLGGVMPPMASAYEDIRKDTLQSVLTGDPTAIDSGNGKIIYIDRFSGIGVRVDLSGVATVTFRGAIDGVNFSDILCASVSATPSALTTAIASGNYLCPVAGLQAFKAQVTSWTSGSVVITSLSTTASTSPLNSVSFDAVTGGLKIAFTNCLAGESFCEVLDPNSYLRTSGAVVRGVEGNLINAAVGNATSAAFTLPNGYKTIKGKITGAGAVAQVITVYGGASSSMAAVTSDVVCTITLSGTSGAAGTGAACPPFIAPFLFYIVVTSGSSGTPTTVLTGMY